MRKTAVVQGRDTDGLKKGCTMDVEEWLGLGHTHILEVNEIGFANRLGVGNEGKKN